MRFETPYWVACMVIQREVSFLELKSLADRRFLFLFKMAGFRNVSGVHEPILPVTETHVLLRVDSIFKINVFLVTGKARSMYKG